MTHLEFQLISTLIAANGRVLTRDELLAHWGDRRPSSRRAIDIHVARLRRKLGEGIIETVRQVGYKCSRTSAAAEESETLNDAPTGLQSRANVVRLEPVALATTG